MRAAAKLPVPKRKITAEVSEVGQGVGIWVARTLVDCIENGVATPFCVVG